MRRAGSVNESATTLVCARIAPPHRVFHRAGLTGRPRLAPPGHLLVCRTPARASAYGTRPDLRRPMRGQGGRRARGGPLSPWVAAPLLCTESSSRSRFPPATACRAKQQSAGRPRCCSVRMASKSPPGVVAWMRPSTRPQCRGVGVQPEARAGDELCSGCSTPLVWLVSTAGSGPMLSAQPPRPTIPSRTAR